MTDAVAYFGTDHDPDPSWCDPCAMTRAECGHLPDCRHGLPAAHPCPDCDAADSPMGETATGVASTIVDDSDPPDRPLWVDVAALLAGGLPEPPQPVSVARQDGQRLFYAGQVNMLFGDPESGKTWLALCAVVEALHGGGSAVVLDMDSNGSAGTLARLGMLGADPDVLSDPNRFRLGEPEDSRQLLRMVDSTREFAPTVAVVDAVGDVLAMMGLNSNSQDDYRRAAAAVLDPLARAGAVVLAIDHLGKSAEARAQGAMGSAAKRGKVGGVSLRVTEREPFAPGRGGTASLTVHKDRPGAVRAGSPDAGKGSSGQRREQPAGLFVLTPHPEGRLSWHVTTPRAEDAHDGYAHRVSAEDIAEVDAMAPEDRTIRNIRKLLGCGQDRAMAVKDAVESGQL